MRGILVPVNILLAIMAMVWQWHEAKRQIELEKQKQALRKAAEDLAAANVSLEGQLKDFDNAAIGLVVGVKTLSIGMRRVTMRYLWGDKALDDMNSTEIHKAAIDSNLQIHNARNEEEAKRVLALAQKAHERGEKLSRLRPHTASAADTTPYPCTAYPQGFTSLLHQMRVSAGCSTK